MWTVRASLVVALSLLAPGFHLALPAAASAAGAQDVIHQVMPGDDLRLIAGYYYSDTRQWQRIWEANRDLVKQPNRIERGTFLRIPNVKVPAEPYADFVARARPPAAPPPPEGKAGPAPAPGAEAQASPASSEMPAPPSPAGTPAAPPAAAAAPVPAAAPGKATALPPPAPPPAKRP